MTDLYCMVKALKKIFFPRTAVLIALKFALYYKETEYYQICSNGDPRLTLTYFSWRSNLVS